MSEKPPPRSRPSPKVWQFYEVKGETLTRKRKSCPRCGRGTFMAEHQDRQACGKCGYTEFNEKQSEGPA